MTLDTEMNMKEVEVCMCYSQAKMTVVEEEIGGVELYNTLKPVELMEYIARAADVRFNEDIPLDEKIMMACDMIYPRYGLRQVRPGEALGADDESDDSVVWDTLNEQETIYQYLNDE